MVSISTQNVSAKSLRWQDNGFFPLFLECYFNTIVVNYSESVSLWFKVGNLYTDESFLPHNFRKKIIEEDKIPIGSNFRQRKNNVSSG